MTNFRGVDEVLQAATGVMSRMTLPGVPPEEFAPLLQARMVGTYRRRAETRC